MTDHTPGPWHVEGDHVVRTDHLAKVLIAFPVEGPYALPYDERRANANLISASPEMFTALEALSRWLDSVLDLGEAGEARRAAAKAAIAKARGETVSA